MFNVSCKLIIIIVTEKPFSGSVIKVCIVLYYEILFTSSPVLLLFEEGSDPSSSESSNSSYVGTMKEMIVGWYHLKVPIFKTV